jgi:hypothetical protein
MISNPINSVIQEICNLFFMTTLHRRLVRGLVGEAINDLLEKFRVVSATCLKDLLSWTCALKKIISSLILK